MSKKKILMLIKTSGIEYDDRLRKECLSLKSIGSDVGIVALEDKNKKSKGISGYGIPYNTFNLFSRKVFPHKKFLVFKVIEMNVKFIFHILLKKPNTLWVHNFELIGLFPFVILLKRIKFLNDIVWDQHELISVKQLERKKLTARYIKYVNSCKYMITANFDRAKYISENFKISSNKIKIIENLVDEGFSSLPKAKIDQDLKSWLKYDNYFLAQGGAGRSRYFIELCEAVIGVKTRQLVVVGPFYSEQVEKLNIKFGESWKEWIYFTGMIPQMELNKYIDSALASIILYSQADSLNLEYCAPNRLYQSISRGIPIVVGNNPPMKRIIDDFECGVVLEDDGKSIEGLKKGLVKAIESITFLKKNVELVQRKFYWEDQINIFNEIIG